MHYFIDGYNLMHRIMRAGDDLKSQRESIVAELNEKIQALDIDATLVFDAQYHYGEGSRSHLKSLEICFTDQGETADDYIIKRIKSSSHPKLETVVTSDNKLAWRARRHLANTMSVQAFMTFLNKKYSSRKRKKGVGDEQIIKQLSKFSILSTENAKQDEPKPAPGKTTTVSFEYYLYHFEMRFREIAAQEPPKKIDTPKKGRTRKQTRPPKSEEPTQSEVERWRRIFEEGVAEESDDE